MTTIQLEISDEALPVVEAIREGVNKVRASNDEAEFTLAEFVQDEMVRRLNIAPERLGEAKKDIVIAKIRGLDDVAFAAVKASVDAIKTDVAVADGIALKP